MTAEKHVGDALKGLPATLLRTISDLYKKERTDEYNKAVGNQADKIVEWRRRNDASSMIDFNYYHVEDGNITIDPRHYRISGVCFVCLLIATIARPFMKMA